MTSNKIGNELSETKFSREIPNKKRNEQDECENLETTRSSLNGLAVKREIKGIILDFDGVLSSLEMRLGGAVLTAARMVKPRLTRRQIIAATIGSFSLMAKMERKKGISFLKFIFQLGKKFEMTNFQAAKFTVINVITYMKYRENIVPKIGVRKVLEEILAQDYKVALITNASRKVITIAESKIPELREFDLVLTRDDVEVMKPNASGFFKALKILGLKADQCISIGDQASDIVAGKTAGIRTVALTGDFMEVMKPHLREYNPDFIIRDVRDLPDLLIFLRDCIIEDLRTTIDLTEQTIQEALGIVPLSSRVEPTT